MPNLWYILQYPQVAEPVGTDFVEPIVPDQTPGWFQPVNQPVLPVEYRHLLPSLFFQGEPDDFVEPGQSELESAWFQATEQPLVLRPEHRYSFPYLFLHLNPLDYLEPGAEESAWFLPTDEPVLPVEYRYTLPCMFVQIDPQDILEVGGPILTLPSRTLTVELGPRTTQVYLPDRTITVELRPGGRQRQ